jgi:hypothetical protein
VFDLKQVSGYLGDDRGGLGPAPVSGLQTAWIAHQENCRTHRVARFRDDRNKRKLLSMSALTRQLSASGHRNHGKSLCKTPPQASSTLVSSVPPAAAVVSAPRIDLMMPRLRFSAGTLATSAR